MSMADRDTTLKDMTDKANFARLEEGVSAVKKDLAALAEQITDTIGNLAGDAGKRARRSYKQAHANVDAAVSDVSERGRAAMDAAQDAATSIEETLEEVITQRPLATVALALGLGFLIGATWRR